MGHDDEVVPKSFHYDHAFLPEGLYLLPKLGRQRDPAFGIQGIIPEDPYEPHEFTHIPPPKTI
jgi:hypothetical protein